MRLSKLLTIAFACGRASALPVLVLPWFGHISLDSLVGYLGYTSDLAQAETIYQVLKDDRRWARYSCLVKAIDLSESVVTLLNDPSKSITFFALPDSKFPCHHKHHGDHGHKAVPSFADSPDDVSHGLGDLIQRAEELEKEPESRDKEKRKQALARIIRKIVEYHILPESYEAAELIQNSTYATSLTLADGSMDSQPLRLSILSTSLPPHLRINAYVEVTKRDIKTKNGVIHQISHPLLPPPSIFQETFLVPEAFSFFTTAIQRVGLTGAIDRWQCSKDGNNVGFSGAIATTVFVPTSRAFSQLPSKLRRYLFSPFGRKALKKLLEYHIVPNFVLHTDYFHNATSNVTESGGCFDDALTMQSALPVPALPDYDDDVEYLALSTNTGPVLELVYEYNATLPTLLQDHHLRVHVAHYKSKWPILCSTRYFTRFKVNGRQVGPYDIPARNGALHVLPTILDPRKGRSKVNSGDDEAAWDDWEEWLPQWAMEN